MVEDVAEANYAAETEVDWAAAVFGRNEEARVEQCVESLARASRGMRMHVSVFVNGSSDRTAERAVEELRKNGLPGNVYKIEYPCKWNAMNAFIHDLRPKARMYAFVDATAFVDPASLNACVEKFNQKPELLVIGGLPKNGRGAQRARDTMLKNGGGMSQFVVVTRKLLDDLVRRGRKIPIGLYRGDGVLSGYIVHETNGKIHREPRQERVGCTLSVEYSISPLSPFNWHDIKIYYNRLVRQARGRIENQAWNSIIWSHGFDALPRFADELILQWLKDHAPRKEGPVGRFFIWQALRRARKWKKPGEEDLVAVLIPPP